MARLRGSPGAALCAFVLGFAIATCLPSESRADDAVAGPAVSGVNAKISGEGGLYDDQDSGLAQGSLTLPLGQRFGLQFDGALGTIDGETMGGGGVHLFTRDPSFYLFGIFASHHSWNSIEISRLAAEVELYRGRTTFSGVLGWEDVNVPGVMNGLRVVNTDDDHFFTELDFSVYPGDNLRLSAGYHYESEASLGVAEVEYMLRWARLPMSLFAMGYFGDEQHDRVTGGARFYFGGDRGKTLIRRHREDDPVSYTPVFPDIQTVTTSSGSATICPARGNFLGADFPGCLCPQGSERPGLPPFTAGNLANCNMTPVIPE